MRAAAAIVLLLSILLTDFLSALVFSYAGTGAAGLIRDSRTLLIVALFLFALFSDGVPRKLAVPLFAYACLVALYALIGLGHDTPISVVFGSAQTLLIPPILFLVGSALVRNGADLAKAAYWYIGVCAATALFGFWDIRNTEFWELGLRYGDYLREVKGIVSGFHPVSGLPWNFTGFEGARRAAGLLAAPLAQGMCLAYGAVLAIAIFRNRSYLLGLGLTALFLFGVYQSGTRGAILVALIAIPIFLYFSSHTYSQFRQNLLLGFFAFIFGALFFAPTFVYTLQLLDASSVAHLRALQTNLSELQDVLIIGHGVGQSGAIAAREGLEIAGGGEGAIFTIIYQLGVPGGVAFLAFYYLAMAGVLRNSATPPASAADRIALANWAIALGFATTLITSDHALSLSGSGAIWLLLGGAYATLERRSVATQAPSHDTSAYALAKTA